MQARPRFVGPEIVIKYRVVDNFGERAQKNPEDREISVALDHLRGPLEDAVHAEALAHLIRHLHVQITNLPDIMASIRDQYVGQVVAAVPERESSSGACIARNKTQPIPHQTIKELSTIMTPKVSIPRGSKILFLDDDETRHRQFKRATLGCLVTQAYSADEAITSLATGTFDAAFLDHDLSVEDVMSAPGAKTLAPTGQVVADYIASLDATRRPGVVLVHSMNPAGSQSMAAALTAANVPNERISFDQLLRAIEIDG